MNCDFNLYNIPTFFISDVQLSSCLFHPCAMGGHERKEPPPLSLSTPPRCCVLWGRNHPPPSTFPSAMPYACQGQHA
eukprot:scaffold161434_cov30-Tisochrysis_lutea.AAC.2